MRDPWDQIKQLFQEALDVPSVQREAWLQENVSDENQRIEVVRLLEHHGEAEVFLESPLGGDARQSSEHTDRSLPPIPGYVLGPLLGRGGMGAVYQAEQQQPLRQVAIKLLRADRQVSIASMSRFRRESELLAKLQHPGIAQIYESGLVETEWGGQPWFAMEQVVGESLLEAARVRQADHRERIEWLIKICNAVQHAHDRGVVHRDLKPSNILVPSDESPAQPKVVDFGIARNLEEPHGLTLTREVLGTLNYLSPEQVNSTGQSSDHRVDIYGLGVIGFELLSGTLPHNRTDQSLTQAITCLGEFNCDRIEAFAREHSRDMQVILCKAMHENPDHRYQTVRELGDDLLRWLRHEPIAARPPTMIYHLSRFVRRNRTLVVGVMTTFLALTVGLVLYAREAGRAREAAAAARYEADKATEVNSYITNDFMTRLLAAASRSSAGPQEVRQLVDQSATHIDSMFGDRPEICAAIHNEVGTIYYSIGALKEAEREYRIAWDLWRSELGTRHPDTLKALSNQAQSRLRGEVDTKTIDMLRKAYQLRADVLGSRDPATLASGNNYAEGLRRVDRLDDATSLLEQIVFGPEGGRNLDATTLENKGMVIAAANLASCYLKLDQPDRALEVHDRVYNAAVRMLGADHETTIQSGLRLAVTLDRCRRYHHAVQVLTPICQLTLETRRDAVAAFSSQRLLARVYRHADDYSHAREVLESALDELQHWPDSSELEAQRAKLIRDLERLPQPTSPEEPLSRYP